MHKSSFTQAFGHLCISFQRPWRLCIRFRSAFLFSRGFVEGHGLSRANKSRQRRALAPEVAYLRGCPHQGASRALLYGVDRMKLQGRNILLEPLGLNHVDGLAAASNGEHDLYRWSPVPQGAAEVTKYIETALAWQAAGTAVPFAILRASDGAVLGSTRFWNIERWAWPPNHPSHGRGAPDACEIGYTWLASSAIRTGANTEAKLLMLRHAFEVWQVVRVCFHTDTRNQRSRAALERIGGKCEGILRAHRMAADFIPRDSVRYSILASEWPEVEDRLTRLLDRCSLNVE